MDKYKVVFEVAGFKGEMVPNRYAVELGMRRPILDYTIITPNGIKIEGHSLVPSIGIGSWDSPECILELMQFMTEGEDSGGDFSDYTPEQMTWFRSNERQDLSYVFGEEEIASYIYYDPEISTEEWDCYTFSHTYDAKGYILKMRRENINVRSLL